MPNTDMANLNGEHWSSDVDRLDTVEETERNRGKTTCATPGKWVWRVGRVGHWG